MDHFYSFRAHDYNSICLIVFKNEVFDAHSHFSPFLYRFDQKPGDDLTAQHQHDIFIIHNHSSPLYKIQVSRYCLSRSINGPHIVYKTPVAVHRVLLINTIVRRYGVIDFSHELFRMIGSKDNEAADARVHKFLGFSRDKGGHT